MARGGGAALRKAGTRPRASRNAGAPCLPPTRQLGHGNKTAGVRSTQYGVWGTEHCVCCARSVLHVETPPRPTAAGCVQNLRPYMFAVILLSSACHGASNIRLVMPLEMYVATDSIVCWRGQLLCDSYVAFPTAHVNHDLACLRRYVLYRTRANRASEWHSQLEGSPACPSTRPAVIGSSRSATKTTSVHTSTPRRQGQTACRVRSTTGP